MPATGRVLLDTNILIALLGEERAVAQHVRDAEAVYVPAIAIGELYYGARKSVRATENVERVAALAAASGARLRCGDGGRVRRPEGHAPRQGYADPGE